ncbi:MAG TPA: hypothetical protein PLU88_07795, partial [Armatimonadota bacterium]|nr:hypothetical protein [Armatimonadota bacterium]
MATRTHSKIRRAAGNGNVYVDPEIIRLNVLSDAALLLSSAERFALSTGAIVSVFSLAEEKLTSAAPNGRVLFGLDQTGFDADDILASHKQTAKLAVEQGQRVDVCDEQGMLQLCSCPILLKYGDRSYSKAVITAEFAESADATLRSVASMMLDQLALQISDQISSMFILHNDLANARAMTTALKVENERLEMFLDHINGGVGILDRDLRVVWSNFETDKK